MPELFVQICPNRPSKSFIILLTIILQLFFLNNLYSMHKTRVKKTQTDLLYSVSNKVIF